MTFLLVSSNPLFAEILRHTLHQAGAKQVVHVTPGRAAEQIALARPEVILVDDSRIDAAALDAVLTVARKLSHSRTILLNLQNNDITIVSAQRATIGKVEDMMNAIRTVEQQGQHDEVGSRHMENPAAAASARAGAYSFLALLCNQRPERSLVQRLRDLGVDGLVNAVDVGEAEGPVRRGLQEMADFVLETAEVPDTEVQEILAVDWTRLFRGVRPGYGPPPPYEGVYTDGDGLRAMHAVAHVYHTYGVTPAQGGAGNRPDYLGLELDFLRYACEQQALAYEQGEEEIVERWTEAERAFLTEHTAKWAPAYCERADGEARTGFYKGALHLIKGVLNEARTENR